MIFHFPKVKFRFEVLFKKFHPRINLTTLFSTKPYLLDTINPFSCHENRSLTKLQKKIQGGYPKEPKFKISEYMQDIKRLLEPKFQLSSSYGLGCRRGTNFCQRRRWRVTDGFFKSVKNMLLFEQFFFSYI
jgi:hypothetical protein